LSNLNKLVAPEYCSSSPGPFVMMILLGVEALLFGLFTICMLCDQYSVVFSSMTQVERLKAELSVKAPPTRPRTTTEHLIEVFGGDGLSIWWLIPVKARWKSREKIFQFVFPRDDFEASLEEGRRFHVTDNPDDSTAGKESGAMDNLEDMAVHERHPVKPV